MQWQKQICTQLFFVEKKPNKILKAEMLAYLPFEFIWIYQISDQNSS